MILFHSIFTPLVQRSLREHVSHLIALSPLVREQVFRLYLSFITLTFKKYIALPLRFLKSKNPSFGFIWCLLMITLKLCIPSGKILKCHALTCIISRGTQCPSSLVMVILIIWLRCCLVFSLYSYCIFSCT